MDRIAFRSLTDCPSDGADGFASERERCEEKGCQSCEQAKDEKAFYRECFYVHRITVVIDRVLWIEDRENKRGCQRNKWQASKVERP